MAFSLNTISRLLLKAGYSVTFHLSAYDRVILKCQVSVIGREGIDIDLPVIHCFYDHSVDVEQTDFEEFTLQFLELV